MCLPEVFEIPEYSRNTASILNAYHQPHLLIPMSGMVRPVASLTFHFSPPVVPTSSLEACPRFPKGA